MKVEDGSTPVVGATDVGKDSLAKRTEDFFNEGFLGTVPPVDETDELTAEPPIEPAGKPEPEKVEAKPDVQSETLNLDEIGDKLILTKVDGVEKTVSVKEMVKGYQTDQFLTRKGQIIADQKRILEAERVARQAPPQPELSSAPLPEEDEFYVENVKPHVAPLKDKIESLEGTITELKALVAPAQHEAGLKTVDSILREEGHTDFMELAPQIREIVLGIEDPQQFKAFDTVEGYLKIFKDLKLKALSGEVKTVKEQIETMNSKTIKGGIKPPPTIEGGGAPSSDATPTGQKIDTEKFFALDTVIA